jgi:hypothetical protein
VATGGQRGLSPVSYEVALTGPNLCDNAKAGVSRVNFPNLQLSAKVCLGPGTSVR